ncbi:MAG TPA: DUF167 domain-containing protein [Acidiphilium sp.]|nr:DUF167 domain-containing protein [Acidiphilium sp.]
MTASPPSPFWADSAAGLLVALKVQPGARRPRLGPVVEAPPSPGWPPARLRVAVAAPPQEGRANEAVLKALAEGLGLSPSRLALRAGAQARDKLVLATGLSAADLAPRLTALGQQNEA